MCTFFRPSRGFPFTNDSAVSSHGNRRISASVRELGLCAGGGGEKIETGHACVGRIVNADTHKPISSTHAARYHTEDGERGARAGCRYRYDGELAMECYSKAVRAVQLEYCV